MKLSILMSMVAGLALAGCCTGDCCKDPVIGNWGLKLPYDSMSAGHMIMSRDAKGNPQALVLWRWASPTQMKNVVVDGPNFSFVMPGGGVKVVGSVQKCGALKAEAFDKKNRKIGDVTGWLNPPVDPSVKTSDAKFGETVDLLKDGLAGWETMDPKAKFGWSFKDGVLSNKLGLRPDGRWAGGGANLKTKLEDFFDFNLEYDVRVPAKSNSGVYLRGRYEVQVVDSFGKNPDYHAMASLYGRIVPKEYAEKAPGEWQHVSVTLYKRHITVVLNGVTIIDNEPVLGITGGAIDANESVPGPIYLQGDHSDADFKNMILRRIVK